MRSNVSDSVSMAHGVIVIQLGPLCSFFVSVSHNATLELHENNSYNNNKNTKTALYVMSTCLYTCQIYLLIRVSSIIQSLVLTY